MSRYYKLPSPYKGNYYLIFLYVITIMVALSSFYIFISTSTFLAYAQNLKNSTEINILFKTADTLFNQKNYDEAIKYYDKILAINASEINALNHKGISLWELQNIMKHYIILTKFLHSIHPI